MCTLLDCVDGEVALIQSDEYDQLNEGRVEICRNRTWGTVCNRSFGVDEAGVVCKQLGYAKIGLLMKSA